eukprot:3503130-Rhodomonas_salina.1
MKNSKQGSAVGASELPVRSSETLTNLGVWVPQFGVSTVSTNSSNCVFIDTAAPTEVCNVGFSDDCEEKNTRTISGWTVLNEPRLMRTGTPPVSVPDVTETDLRALVHSPCRASNNRVSTCPTRSLQNRNRTPRDTPSRCKSVYSANPLLACTTVVPSNAIATFPPTSDAVTIEFESVAVRSKASTIRTCGCCHTGIKCPSTTSITLASSLSIHVSPCNSNRTAPPSSYWKSPKTSLSRCATVTTTGRKALSLCDPRGVRQIAAESDTHTDDSQDVNPICTLSDVSHDPNPPPIKVTTAPPAPRDVAVSCKTQLRFAATASESLSSKRRLL